MRILVSSILYFSLICIFLLTYECFLEKKFLKSATIRGVTKLRCGLSMRRSCWGAFWEYAKAAPARSEHAIKRLRRILSMRQSRPQKFPQTLWHSECAWKPLRRALSGCGSRWGAYRAWGEAAEALTEHAQKPLRRSLSMGRSSCGALWVYAKAVAMQPGCTGSGLVRIWSRMYMISDHISTWSTTVCIW